MSWLYRLAQLLCRLGYLVCRELECLADRQKYAAVCQFVIEQAIVDTAAVFCHPTISHHKKHER